LRNSLFLNRGVKLEVSKDPIEMKRVVKIKMFAYVAERILRMKI